MLLSSYIPGTHCQVSAQQESSRLKFRNMAIGFGFNRSEYEVTFPETPYFTNTDTKQSLLIDIRANFFTLYGLQISSIFQLWSWTDNSGARSDLPQNGMNDFAFMFDLIKFVPVTDNLQLFGGGGGGIHLLSNWSNFPQFTPYYEEGTGNQLKQIIEHKTKIAPDFLLGLQYQLWEGMFVTGELRYEFTDELKQWKYLISFSLF